MNVDIQLLLKFVAVAEELSFSRAAERLGMAQPGLSRQIGQLETSLGFMLFERTTRQVKLTEKGRRLFERAQLIAEEYNTTRLVAASLARDTPSRLRIGLPYYAIFVDERLELFDRFSKKHPDIDVEFRTSGTRRLLRDVRDGDLEASFVAYESGDQDFESLAIARSGIDIILSEKDALAKKKSLSLADLSGRSLSTFLRQNDSTLFDLLLGAFDRKKTPIHPVKGLGFTRRLEEGKSFSAIPGWALLPGHDTVRRPLKEGGSIKLQLVRRKGLRSPALDQLWGLAAETAV